MRACRERYSVMGAISSCPIWPRIKVLMPPLGHWLLMGRSCHAELQSSTETLGSSNNHAERKVNPSWQHDSPSSISRLLPRSTEGGVTCSLSFPCVCFFFFLSEVTSCSPPVWLVLPCTDVDVVAEIEGVIDDRVERKHRGRWVCLFLADSSEPAT